jgi:hypothetical protein
MGGGLPVAVKPASKAGRQFGFCIADIAGLVAGDVVEADDERIRTYPFHFVVTEPPLLRSEIEAVQQAFSDDVAASTRNRDEMYAAAEARDREARAKELAARAEEDLGVRARWSKYWEGQRTT